MKEVVAGTTLLVSLFLLGACTMFKAKEVPPPQPVPKPLSVPVGKNWQVIEEAPTLTNERHEQRLPFQMEQSVQPAGAPPAAPIEKRKVETPETPH